MEEKTAKLKQLEQQQQLKIKSHKKQLEELKAEYDQQAQKQSVWPWAPLNPILLAPEPPLLIRASPLFLFSRILPAPAL